MKWNRFAALACPISAFLLFAICFYPTKAFVPARVPSKLGTSSTTAIMGIKGFRSWFESQFPQAILDMPKDSSTDSFDHVLIDMNQLLHIVVRKSRSDGHALTLLMKELDACVQMATPEKSLVLAMDGPPSAAKLATQRKRRFSTVVKTEYKQKQYDLLFDTGAGKNHNTSNETDTDLEKPRRRKKRINPKALARKQRKLASELRTLCITPGTEFMAKAEQALLYWSWQRLGNRNNVLASNNVRIFISPSTVPGEGEVKLLEWIYSKNRRGESIAILGGDSDLVLEGLIIPTKSTHNVFVLLPEGSKRYLSVSMWETTRSFCRMLPEASTTNIMKIRTDLVLLLILNGNDYLPKLRGSSGFNKLFHSYLRVQKDWHKEGKSDDAYLVDPATLEFNLEFCKSFFSRLALLAPRAMWTAQKIKEGPVEEKRTALQQLNNFIDSGFLPKPMAFHVVGEGDAAAVSEEATGDEDEVDSDEDDADLDGDDDLSDEEMEVETIHFRLMLGEPGTEDFYTYDITSPKGVSIKHVKQKLAAIALADLMEVESDTDDDDDLGSIGLSNTGYSWEVHQAVEGKVETYLYGLLWNLQTYQDGVCADYAYNYGKRLSPSAKEIVSFFSAAAEKGSKVGPQELVVDEYSHSVSAGIACLAALPSNVKELVPAPYRQIPDDTVEELYASCMDKVDNTFDMKKFERICEEEVEKLQLTLSATASDQSETEGNNTEIDGRKIHMGDHYWTVVSNVQKPLPHPFDPPLPFSERLSKLRKNPRIRVSRFMVVDRPYERDPKKLVQEESDTKSGFVKKESRKFEPADPGAISQYPSVEQVPFRKAYTKSNSRDGQRKGRLRFASSTQHDHAIGEKKPAERIDEDTFKTARKDAQIIEPVKGGNKSLDGLSPMACIKQLEDASMIGAIEWEVIYDQKTKDDQEELVRLSVKRGSSKGKAILFEDLAYEEKRDVNGSGNTSRRAVKQNLAALALAHIAGPERRWNSVVFKDLKTSLKSRADTEKSASE